MVSLNLPPFNLGRAGGGRVREPTRDERAAMRQGSSEGWRQGIVAGTCAGAAMWAASPLTGMPSAAMMDASWWHTAGFAFAIWGTAFAFAPFNREASRTVGRWGGASTGFLGVMSAAWQAGWLPG